MHMRCRVLDIMRRDADRDPEAFPDALRARKLLNQVRLKFFLFFFHFPNLVYLGFGVFACIVK